MPEQEPWAVTRGSDPARASLPPAHPLYRDEDRFRTIVETVHEGIWLVDGAARTLFVNERMADLLGYRPDELVGRTVMEFCFDEDLANAGARVAANLAGRF